MVETLGALSGAFGSGHRHLPQAEATGGFRLGSPSGNGGADGNSSLLSIRSETEKNGEQIASEVVYKKGKLCAISCRMEGRVSDDAVSWSDYLLPSGALWSDEEGGWLKELFFVDATTNTFLYKNCKSWRTLSAVKRGCFHGCRRSQIV